MGSKTELQNTQSVQMCLAQVATQFDIVLVYAAPRTVVEIGATSRKVAGSIPDGVIGIFH
jgi:hypothetical protein